MHKLRIYFAGVTAIMIVFLANTINVVVGPAFLKKSEGIPKPVNHFLDSGELDTFVMDDDSMELVIGINKISAEAYSNIADLICSFKGRIVNTISLNGSVNVIVADVPLNAVFPLEEELQRTSLARYVEPNKKVQAQFVPNDPYWASQWGPQKIEVDWAWNTSVGSHDVLVAVVDTGINYTHPDIAPNYIPLGYDWYNDDADPMDDNGHGTHCAGIIGAVLNNTLGIAGIANVSLMAEKVLNMMGGGFEDDVAAGITHATNAGAKIISMSLGGPHGEVIHEAVRYAYENGVLLIAAAGNDDTNSKLYPAGYDEVVAVAATDQNDNKAGFSNWGDWIELAAPGVDIYSTTLWNYESWSGTSMACPHVAGVAALVWSQYLDMTRDEVRLWLRHTADDLGAPGFDMFYGYGRINARKAAGAKFEHELIVNLNASTYIEPSKNISLNATVQNDGLYDETNVELQFFINNTLANSTVIPELTGGASFTLNYLWTPDAKTFYNLTAYASPLLNENFTSNNIETKIVYVDYPLIKPLEGQYVNYTFYHYDTSGNLWGEIGYYNITYECYVEPYKILATVQGKDPWGALYSSCAIVNTMTRHIECGDLYMWWFMGIRPPSISFYPFWIETNISLGSRIKLFGAYDAVVYDNEVLVFPGPRPVDCWLTWCYDPYFLWTWFSWFDKTSGMMTRMRYIEYFSHIIEYVLADTNVPIEHRDVAAINVTTFKTTIGQGYSTSVNVTVENHGVSAETVNVTLYANSTYVTSQILDLAVLESTAITFTWNTTDFAGGNYTITAYVLPVPDELDMSDNTVYSDSLFVTIAGDVTDASGSADGIVDMRDIGAICGNFMTTPSSPNWNLNMDINDDSVVDMRDIGIACSNFMKT